MRLPVRRLAAIVVAIAVLGFAALVVAVTLVAAADDAQPSDAIVVLGAAQYNGRPSPVFRARLNQAAVLYRRGFAATVLVTGGVGHGDVTSEAAAGRDYLLKAGLPAGAVVALPGGATTYASLEEVQGWFAARPGRAALLVSDGFHLLRLRLIARHLGLVPHTSPAPESPIAANPRLNAAYLLAEGVKVPLTWLLLFTR
ncbi:MAG TPA: YdcF family protein [Gemmatimonadales bacterium]|nr:YdcF family protein [Gemmatimonadales bacterium]